jgi:outer membrane protein
VKLNSILAVGLVLGAVALTMRSQTAPPKPAPLAAKIAIVAMRDAMLSTLDGKAAAAEMNTKYGAKRAELDKEQAAITAAEEKLRNGAATMSADARNAAAAQLANRKKNLDRAAQDLDDSMQQDDNRLMQDISGKMGTVIDGYAKKNGFTVVMDASVPVLWAAESANVTPEIVKAYDAAHPKK